MNAAGSPPVQVPVLTDVVEWTAVASTVPLAATPPAQPTAASGFAPALPPASAEPAALPSEDEMVARIVGELQRQVELMLDYRLRETLTPVLSRLADALVREARSELASTLRDLVARAVAQEMARHRKG